MGLLLYAMKSYFYTGGYVILDSVFSILKGLIQLKKKVIFACAFIKKRIHGTSMVPFKEMENSFGEVELGDIDDTQGKVDDVI